MLKSILRPILIVLSCFYVDNINASESIKSLTLQIKEGNLTFEQLIVACPEIAKITPSKFINKSVSGMIIEVNKQKYEIRYFSFEDPENKLPKGTTFNDYICNNKLLQMKSSQTNPLPGIIFESFDFRKS